MIKRLTFTPPLQTINIIKGDPILEELDQKGIITIPSPSKASILDNPDLLSLVTFYLQNHRSFSSVSKSCQQAVENLRKSPELFTDYMNQKIAAANTVLAKCGLDPVKKVCVESMQIELLRPMNSIQDRPEGLQKQFPYWDRLSLVQFEKDLDDIAQLSTDRQQHISFAVARQVCFDNGFLYLERLTKFLITPDIYYTLPRVQRTMHYPIHSDMQNMLLAQKCIAKTEWPNANPHISKSSSLRNLLIHLSHCCYYTRETTSLLSDARIPDPMDCIDYHKNEYIHKLLVSLPLTGHKNSHILWAKNICQTISKPEMKEKWEQEIQKFETQL